MSDAHREFCERRHRVLGQYLATVSWNKGWDCVVVQRGHLERFLELDRFKSARMEWFEDDIKTWFPYHLKYVLNQNTLSSLFLSRFSLSDFAVTGTMTDENRIEEMMQKGGPKGGILELPRKQALTEEFVVAQLALLCAGIQWNTAYGRFPDPQIGSEWLSS